MYKFASMFQTRDLAVGHIVDISSVFAQIVAIEWLDDEVKLVLEIITGSEPGRSIALLMPQDLKLKTYIEI